ncbi:MAG: sigma-70 family RNA polymerase sigma factor [Planctomycetes bacterium]|nr:sigma-70 family RNA polymerase sigma factor [Planctomycetota bacterium]
MGLSGQTVQIQRWIDRLQAGDESARDELIKSACARMERLTHNMLKSYPRVQRWEQTDDVFQNAVMRLYRSLADIKPKTVQDFFRLAALNIRRELLDLVKHYYGPRGQGAKHSTNPGGDADDASRPPYEKSDDTYEPGRIALWQEFHQKVEELPEEERQAFDLLWYQGLTQAEAAEILQVTERTVKRRWQSARLMLHDALHGEMPDL